MDLSGSLQERFSRRGLLKISGGSVVGLSGLILVSGSSETARANVTMGTLEIDSGDFTPGDGEVFAPWILVSGDYEYQVQEEPAKWEVYMLIAGSNGNTETVAMTEGSASSLSGSGTYSIRGAVTATSFYDSSDFTVADGEGSITVDVPVEIALVIRNSSDDMLVQERVSDTASITVNESGETTASLSGDGSVVAQDDESDPTPTPPSN